MRKGDRMIRLEGVEEPVLLRVEPDDVLLFRVRAGRSGAEVGEAIHAALGDWVQRRQVKVMILDDSVSVEVARAGEVPHDQVVAMSVPDNYEAARDYENDAAVAEATDRAGG